MNASDNKRKRYKPGERVSLTKNNANLVEQLLNQVHEALPDLKLTKFDMVNWLLKARSDKLTQRELTSIERTYFDPVKALEAAIAEAKKNRAWGKRSTLKRLLVRNCCSKNAAHLNGNYQQNLKMQPKKNL